MRTGQSVGGVAALVAASFALGLLSGCANSPSRAQSNAETQPVQDKAGYDYASSGGKTYLTANPIQLCSEPGRNAECEALSAKTYVGVNWVEMGGVTGAPATYFRVSLDDGRSGYVLASELLATATEAPSRAERATAECKRRGEPRIGMSYKQVEATCWGKPDHVNRSQTAAGIDDQYVYSNGRYVYLRNGVVTSIQTSGTLR